ncbi:hypothetical protein U0070_002026 [Myodes glareolus]|uniref:Uncharacterized protein n=1 Tax=Myodes glareolus TaxID=447135 RepID=A0AAW0HST7_MYOGA
MRNTPRRNKCVHYTNIKLSLATENNMKWTDSNTRVFTVDVKTNKRNWIKQAVKSCCDISMITHDREKKEECEVVNVTGISTDYWSSSDLASGKKRRACNSNSVAREDQVLRSLELWS